MLVCTPSPFATESLLGYVLRVSETNGYETPWYALRLAGIRPNQMTTAGFPAEKFAKVLNRNPEALARIAYRSPDSDDGGFRLLGHPLGDGLSIKPLRLSKPAICPDCVTENRYVDAFFDLNLAIACPVHRKMLVHACPACGERLSWFRPGLLTCRCGASLAEIDPVPVSQELGDLMSVLKAKLHGTALSALDLQTTLPGEQLLAMPLRSLLLKLPAFARFNRPGAGDDTLPIMEGAAEALTNWPHGFHRFLENAGESRCPAGTAYRKRFEHVFSTLFKGTSTGKELQWLRDEFVRYGLEHVRDAIIDNKMLRCGVTGRRYVTKKELARRLGVSPVTLRKWADKGLIELKRVEVARQPRYIADANRAEFTPPVAGEGAVLEQRQAADYLSIPVTVLSHLKKRGHFPCAHRLRHKGGYHQADLDAFHALLLALSPRVAPSVLDEVEAVSLEQVLDKYRFHDSQSKAAFVVAYLTGQITSVGRIGDSVAHILFQKEDVVSRVAASRAQAARGALTQKEAAQVLECDPQAIPGLLAVGKLEATSARERLRVTRQSVEQFLGQYVALSKLSNDLNSSTKRLARLCREGGLELLTVPRKAGSGIPFIERQRETRLLEFSRANPSREALRAAREGAEPRAVVAMRRYLAGW